jgi:hypothetical protein
MHFMTNESFSDFREPIYSYTRKQAIADGVLVDLGDNTLIRAHWKYPLATTSAVWNTIQSVIRDDGGDLDGILHDLSVLAKLRIRGGVIDAGNTVRFTAKIGKGACKLKLHLGPGDNHAPVLTLMFDGED